MKDKSIVPTQQERVMREDDFIVSKTDPKGIILYCNPIFIEFSGYEEADLLGSQHNVVRHPDMPRATFKLVWETIKAGKEMFAYVKNLSKDGSFYWVFAHITPDFGSRGEIVGYTSVRRHPSRRALDKIIPIYKKMIEAEKTAGARDAVAAGTAVLTHLLTQNEMTYEQFIFSL